MSKLNFQTACDRFKKLQRTLSAYNHVLGITYLDAATAAPKGSYAGRGQTMEVMSQIQYDLIASADNAELIAVLTENIDNLEPQTRRELEVFRKEFDRIHRIPAEEYVAYSVLLNESQSIWEEAKNNNDFASFAPYLEKIIAYNRKFAGYYNPEMAPYDALLNEYEEGMNTKVLDAFFEELRSTIVPLLEKISAVQQIDDHFLYKRYPIEIQRLFSDYLMDELAIDRNYCGIAETEHPFTTNFNNKDVRITTHYHEDNLASSMYSVIHEGGHAIYELGCDDCYNHTLLSSGVSMGIHESQSRFFENIIGRSQSFIFRIFPKLKELFPEQLERVTAEQFFRAVNKAQPSLIRTEADDLTYCLHIMVRYKIEKRMIDGSISVEMIPEVWNSLYKEYLGIDVPNDSLGCLQDSHWSGGMIGYFPSYALGSAYGAQMLAVMSRDIGDVFRLVEEGKLFVVKEWLRSHIHRHASFVKPNELFEDACGSFDARYYAQYLTEKYTKLYGLER